MQQAAGSTPGSDAARLCYDVAANGSVEQTLAAQDAKSWLALAQRRAETTVVSVARTLIAAQGPKQEGGEHGQEKWAHAAVQIPGSPCGSDPRPTAAARHGTQGGNCCVHCSRTAMARRRFAVRSYHPPHAGRHLAHVVSECAEWEVSPQGGVRAEEHMLWCGVAHLGRIHDSRPDTSASARHAQDCVHAKDSALRVYWMEVAAHEMRPLAPRLVSSCHAVCASGLEQRPPGVAAAAGQERQSDVCFVGHAWRAPPAPECSQETREAVASPAGGGSARRVDRKARGVQATTAADN